VKSAPLVSNSVPQRDYHHYTVQGQGRTWWASGGCS
jgi:hypothetical protein